MSFLEMPSAPVANMSKAIISLWFRINKVAPSHDGLDGPDEDWNMDRFPPPPNPASGFPAPANRTGIPANGDVLTFYNPYGEPRDVTADPSANPIIHPLIPVGRLRADGGAGGIDAPVVPHDRFNIMMSFGNPNIPFRHRPWVSKVISTMDGVLQIPAALVGVFVPFDSRPIPYDFYYSVWGGNAGARAGTPVGADGKMPVLGLMLGEPTSHMGIIPQSFIGVDKKNRLRILLQTNNRADYKGYAFVQEKAKELMMLYSRDYGTTEAGADGWGFFGPFWAGYEFEHKDVSNDLMTQWPEFFLLQGPQVQDGWNHLLLSFDIDKTVTATLDALPDGTRTDREGNPMFWLPAFSESCTTGCKAWMTLNNRDQTHFQNPFSALPFYQSASGILIGGLPGQNPQSSGGMIIWPLTRQQLRLGPNDIVPQNVFASSIHGIPKRACHRAWASTLDEYISATYWSKQGTAAGDGLPTMYRGAFGFIPPVHNGKPASPLQLTVADPETFDKPTYSGGPFSIPTEGYPIGLPVTSSLVTHNMGCDQAELQIWIGQAANTSTIKHLFISADGKPAPMNQAWDVLGKPDIALHGTGNWKKGANTGKSGFDEKGGKTPIGQFLPVAKIEAFKPEPELGK